MKKGYVIGGLAVLGAIALIAYLKKPKRNSEGFFGATGKGGTKSTVKGMCAQCRTSSGTLYHTGEDRNCVKGDSCVTKYAFASDN